MDDMQSAKAPVHLWIVGLLALVVNGFGSVDYTMTRMRNTEWLSMGGGDAQAMLAWVDSFPIYAQFGWGLGVWMGLIGAVLLLMRHRWAVLALGLSLVGALLGLGYQIIASPPPPPMNEGGMAMVPWIILALVAGFFIYAYRQKQAGVLR